jgi:NAD(P)-dependent dehydrogenase (short-subunit alcohol dehydrogenase family)
MISLIQKIFFHTSKFPKSNLQNPNNMLIAHFHVAQRKTTHSHTTMASTTATSLFSVAGKNVLITGGSRGIGLMMAQGLVQAGANVLLTSRSEDACREAAEELHCHYVVSNVSNRAGCEALAEHVSKVFASRLHVLVNNAGTSWGEPLTRPSRTNWGWDNVMDLNVKGVFYLTLACQPFLKNAATPEDPARIINIGSVAGWTPQEAPTHAYDVSKAALHHLTRKMAADYAKDHITVNAIAPGFVPSRMSAGLAAWGADAETLAKHVPLGRLGTPEDMSGACIYLSSRAGAWCTGVILNVDGGTIGAQQIPLSSL